MAFPFEKMMVYTEALRCVRLIERITRLCKGHVSYPYLDQLTRAALSIPLNIAEGYGRWNPGEKAQAYRIARGSAFEYVPVLQLIRESGKLDEAQYREIYDRLDHVSKMLTNLIKSVVANR